MPCSNPSCSSPADEDRPLKACGRCKAARYCSVDCQRAHWRAGHKAQCRPSPTADTAAPDGPCPLFIMPAGSSIGQDHDVPLRACHGRDGQGRSSVLLKYSLHAGPAALRPYVLLDFGEENKDMGWTAEGLVSSMSWAIVTSPIPDPAGSILLAPGEALFNTEKYPGEVACLMRTGIISDTGKRHKMNFYPNMPICAIHIPQTTN